MNESLLDQIDQLFLIQNYREFLSTFLNVPFEIRSVDGASINSTEGSTSRIRQQRDFSNDRPLIQRRLDLTNPTPDKIPFQSVDDVLTYHKPTTYVAPTGFRKILIPIIYQDEVVGLLLTGETGIRRFTDDQIESLKTLIQSFLTHVIQSELTPLQVNMFKTSTVSRQKQILNKAISYIRKNFHNNDLTLKDVSDHIGVSYHYLSRLFKNELSTTFAHFRNKVRMEAAAKMLKNQRLSVSQVSYACGFDDPAYFCKVFKSFFSTSPMGYRNSKSQATVSFETAPTS